MADTPAPWAEEQTLGGRARTFWWRLEPDGALTLRRIESAPKGPRGYHERRIARHELDRLAEFMADSQWHPLAAGAQAIRAGAPPHGIGACLHAQLGWSATATSLASHLATVLVAARLWEWNGQRKGMQFRQIATTPRRLADLYRQRCPDGTVPDSKSPRGTPPAFDLATRFHALATTLRGRLAECDSGGRHAVEKGQRREAAVRDFLRDQLPPRIGLTRGEVVSAIGEISRQADILLYDAHHAPILLDSPASRLLAIESVHAVIEVKPHLTVTELTTAVANIRSVKALRAAAPTTPGTPPPPLFGAIFSFHAADHRLIARSLNKLERGLPPSLRIDAICTLDTHVIHRRGPILGLPCPTDLPASFEPTLYAIAAGADSLLLFYLLLLDHLNTVPLPPPNLLHYAVQGMRLPAPEEF
ncbi:MAG: hypothetical protein ISS72_06545 [Candidatus Brocadiae bacterium]|nr:hypothetical protein [Candidatus Brocadiia bacterium]